MILEATSRCIRILCAAAVMLTAALAASAQRTQRVAIRVIPELDPNVSIRVVLNGNEDRAFNARYDARCTCWIGVWPGDHPSARFTIRDAHASLRYLNARTDCNFDVRRTDDPDRVDDWAWFSFRGNSDPTLNVELSTSPPGIDLGYRRTMRKPDCVESGTYGQPVRNVRFSKELLQIQVGQETRNAEAPGFSVNRSIIVRNPEKGTKVKLRRGDVIRALATERVEGTTGAAALSSNAIEIDVFRFRSLGLNDITITVK